MGYARIVTPIPGPKSAAWIERRKRAVAPGVSLAHPIFAASASGSTITDLDGNTFLDFAGGIGCLNVGHARPEVVEAARAQLEKLTHACFQVTGYESYVEVCEALCRLAPGQFEKRAALFSTGAECTENAVKIARRATKRQGVLCFEHAFHGRTLLGMTMTSKANPYKVGMGPFAPEVYRLPYPYPYRDASIVGRVEKALATLVAPSDLAAVIIEPVLGEGGFIVPPKEFFSELRTFCDKHGIVFISDEVQSGMGRTGRMFASEVLGFTPDLTTVAKSIAGGLPLSGVVGRSSIMDAVPVGGVGGTFAGNPVSCAAAMAAIRTLELEVSSGRAEALGQRVRSRLEAFAERKSSIGEVRGLGPMIAMELVRDRKTKEPADSETKEIITRARNKGLLLLSAGTYSNVLRLLFPLTIPEDALDEGLEILEQSFP
ncbi:MAG: 4-aminobutyrate--2-oxoglutarate transaminase [Deltaproteobacteria bacterium]|nr:4-aminobutyrate--2-oxoglutarate transaminase [Deltaproteobacteria bacterium]